MKHLVLMSTFLFLSIFAFADDCGVPLDCPAGIKYPYFFCVMDEFGNITKLSDCAEDPYEYASTHPNTFVTKAKLPIFPFLEGSGRPKGMQYANKYRDGKGREIVLVGEDFTVESPSSEWDFIINGQEITLACDKWNCVCGYTTTPALSGTLVKIEITDDAKKFVDKDPYNYLAITARAEKIYYNEETDSYYCNSDYNESKIYFNFTPEFLYNDDKFPVSVNTPIKKGWVSQDYLGNAELVPHDVHIFSFLQVAIHEFGHILGFGHYNEEDLSGGVYNVCDNGDYITSGIMKYGTDDIRKENIIELSDDDKCMMAKLYCPELVKGSSIYDYEEQNTRYPFISPNPTSNYLNVELAETHNRITAEVLDLSGKVLLEVNFENVQNFRINFPFVLSNGTYMLHINADGRRSYTNFIIAK